MGRKRDIDDHSQGNGGTNLEGDQRQGGHGVIQPQGHSKRDSEKRPVKKSVTNERNAQIGGAQGTKKNSKLE